MGKYLRLAQEALRRRSEAAPDTHGGIASQADLDALVDAMVQRLNEACPADWSASEAFWRELDPIEQRVNTALASGSEVTLRAAIADYEAAILSQPQTSAA